MINRTVPFFPSATTYALFSAVRFTQPPPPSSMPKVELPRFFGLTKPGHNTITLCFERNILPTPLHSRMTSF